MLLKRKENKMDMKKSLLLVIGSLLIFISIFLFSFNYYNSYKDDLKEQKNLDDFYKEQEEIKEIIKDNKEDIEKVKVDSNYIAVLKIDKINLEKGLYEIGNSLNNVDHNIEILSGSNMPNVENGNLVLASHNGYLKESYFRNLYRLEIHDKVSVFYDCYEYVYEVINIYKVEKTGTVKVIRNNNKNTLTLITCSGDNEQLVVVAELINRI